MRVNQQTRPTTLYTSGNANHCRKGQKLAVNVPMANGTYVLLLPTAGDLAALATLAPPPSAENPDHAYSTAFAPDEDYPTADDHASAASLVAAGAGSVLAAAALSFTLLV
ncbi:hypothetical protein ACP4OV_007148 [Aristida adscensionis]